MTFVELLVALCIISIGMLGFTGSFRFITHSIRDARAKSLALSLAQEKVENLKNTPYHKLQISTQVVTYTQVTPNQICDAVNYPPETIKVGGITYTRCVYVSLTRITDDVVEELSALYPDSGLKWVEVVVFWEQRGEWKKLALNNLHENPNVQPLNATIQGRVTDPSGNAVPGAVVTVLDKADWEDITDSAGSYLIQVNEGSYFLRASSAGYFDTIYSSVTLAESQSLTTSFALLNIATGSVTGNVFFSSHVIISQVVVGTYTRVGDTVDPSSMTFVEYIELFNPTTYTFNWHPTISWKPFYFYLYSDGVNTHGYWDMNAISVRSTMSIPANSGYLIANASWFMIGDQWIRSDAHYGNDKNWIGDNTAGNIGLLKADTWETLDAVSWYDNERQNSNYVEGNAISSTTCADGIGLGNLLIRYSSPTKISDGGMYAAAYDSGNNSLDFAGPHMTCKAGMNHPVMNWTQVGPIYPYSTFSGTQTVIGGIPAYGALVTANDLIGGTTNAYRDVVVNGFGQSQPYARFNLTGVSTGTWTVLVATREYFAQISSVIVPAVGGIAIPNANTSPSWSDSSIHVVRTTQPVTGGYVNGLVRNAAGTALSGISVLAGGVPVTTGSNGRYFAAVATGPITVVINPGNANASYQEYIDLDETITSGGLVTVSADLVQRGVVMGYMSSDGNSVLPNIQVTASRNGQQFGATTSDSSGNFYFRNLTTGTYQIEPTLDPLEIWSPSSFTAVAVAGSTIHVGTFVVTGAQGRLSGTVTNNGALVTTGALILVTTGTLSSTPPAIVASSAAAQTVIYSGSSKADGTYEIEVRGSTSTTYRVSAYIPVISGTSVSVATKTYTGIVVYSTGTTTKNITIP